MKSKLTLGIIVLAALVLSLVPAAAVGTQHAEAQSICDWAQFITDVTVPDNTVLQPGTTFTKTWRLKNIGTCTWTTSYSLVFDSGTQMGGPNSVNFPNSVAPGQTVDISVNLTAPSTAGNYIGYWKFRNASGVIFGIGTSASKSWWVEINVPQAAPSYGVIYDFTPNLCSANVRNDTQRLPCPGTDGDKLGFALTLDNPILENGVQASAPGILMSPQQVYNGTVYAIFPQMTFFKGDLFQATVGCQNSAFGCYVRYVLWFKSVNDQWTTLWNWDEKYDGLSYNASVKLNSLDGKTGSLVLGIRALGSPTDDRALWIHPVVLRPGISVSTPTPTPTVGPGTPTVTPTAQPPSCTDKAKFISDVTVPDGTLFAPNTPFVKTWQIKNVGTCTWTTSYALIFESGNQMGGPSPANFPSSVAPSQTVNLSVNLTAPSAGGKYVGYWRLRNANNVPFGIGVDALHSFWVDINVSGAAATPTPPMSPTPGGPTPTPPAGAVYDFASNVCSAAWFSGAGALPCPGTDGSSNGFVLQVNNPTLESGAASSGLGLVTFPQNVYNGYIQGIYPPYTVKAGDRFRSIVNCSYGQSSCYVIFRLDYQSGSGPITTFWAFAEKYDGQYYQANLDLSPLVGQNVKFILTVLSVGSATGDRALWVNPMIYNSSSGSISTPNPPTSTAVPTTPTPTTTGTNTSNWNTYQNTKYGFSFKFPPGSVVSGQTDTAGRVYFPLVTQGTNLQEKFVDVSVVEGATTCKSPSTSPMATSENVTINGVAFLKETGEEGAAGNIYNWIGYSTTKGTACISLTFVLHATNPGNYQTPPPVYDMNSESAIFSTIMSTYANQ
ncbi:MAG: NBR1-Ig-like domain-containing protein [Chloroflexi bacterium]|nr:NBR1-Ig-like domain-containing protein [Chloroflexota bacterium]